MSSQEGLQLNMIPLRRRVIADVLSIKQEACPSFKVNKFIIRPSQLDYPIEKPFNKCMHTSSYVEEKMCNLFPLEYNRGQDMSVFVGRDIEVSTSTSNYSMQLAEIFSISLFYRS